MSDHHVLSPSAAHRWCACPGSVLLTKDLPYTTSEFAEEGTRAHKLAEECLKARRNPDTEDKQMDEYVQSYIDYVRFHANGATLLLTEFKVDLSAVIPGGYGTIDAVILKPSQLHIVDLKYGKGVKVDAENNLQLIIYAIGIYDQFNFIFDFDFKKVKMTIHQPRLDHVSEWEISISELEVYRKMISESAQKAMYQDADIVPGEKQCRWCGVKATCRARAELLRSLAKYDFDDYRLLSVPEILKFYKDFDSIKAWISDVEMYVFEKALSGEKISGYKLVEGRANRKWSDEKTAANMLKDLVPEKILFKKEIVGIPAIEKYLGKGNEILKILVTKPDGKPVLVPESDKRTALNSSAQTDFKD